MLVVWLYGGKCLEIISRTMRYKIQFFFGLLLLFVQLSCAQAPADRPHALGERFDEKVSNTIEFTVPLIGVDELKKIKQDVHIFDTREKEEYEVSHIDGAQYLGYDDFDAARLGDLKKDDKIVLYCSIGYRSEKIGERLQKMGYTNVHNLYGSLFDWVNRGNEVVEKNGESTQKVHTYNWLWSRWVNHKAIEKVW